MRSRVVDQAIEQEFLGECGFVLLPDAYRPTLARARDLYIDGGYGDPRDGGVAVQLAERLVDEITEAAAATLGDS